MPAAVPSQAHPLPRHVADLLGLAGPLAVAQIAQMAMAVTDTVLLGSLGERALAAGGLGASLFFTVNIMLQGVLQPVGILAAQSRGAGRPERVPAIYWTGLLLAALLVLPAFAGLSHAGTLLRAAGDPPGLVQDVDAYLRVLRWGVPGGLIGIGVMRSFLNAVDAARILLVVAPVAVVANGLLNYGLIHGAWGLPALGFLGSATATAVTLWATSLVLLAAAHLRRRTRGFARPAWPVPRLLGDMLVLGLPIGATYGIETFLFLATGLIMGRLGPAALAAHQIALNVAASCFMVPLAISHAANARVAFWTGAGRPAEVRRAGFTAVLLGAVFMCLTGLVLLAAPRLIIGAYLDLHAPGNAATVAIAVSLLGMAALFQVADGVQSVASGALRGLRDTRVPMLLAAFGYWGLGFPAGWALAFRAGAGPTGLWIGLAAGLAAVATMMTWRFHARTRRT
jgi:MATE family multidrug resistance protein